MLLRELKTRIKRAGNFDIYKAQSTIYVEPLNDSCDLDAALESAKKVFGIISIGRACVCEKNIDAIFAATKEYIPQFLTGVKTFKADARRADKTFPMTSPELAGEVGAAVLEAMPRIKVDLDHPEVVVRVEIREHGAYIHAGQIKGAGGMPLGSSGRGLLLLSGGIDSPVAGYMMAKRGVTIEALHFESFPYTSERAVSRRREIMISQHPDAGHAGRPREKLRYPRRLCVIHPDDERKPDLNTASRAAEVLQIIKDQSVVLPCASSVHLRVDRLYVIEESISKPRYPLQNAAPDISAGVNIDAYSLAMKPLRQSERELRLRQTLAAGQRHAALPFREKRLVEHYLVEKSADCVPLSVPDCRADRAYIGAREAGTTYFVINDRPSVE